MNAPSEDIKDMLVADTTLGLTFATNLFTGLEPSNPNSVVTIFDTPGFPLDLNMDKSEVYQRPSVQIRVRNVGYLEAYNLAENIVESLHGRAAEEWNGSTYTVIRCTGSPSLLDWDENNRARFIINFNLQRR